MGHEQTTFVPNHSHFHRIRKVGDWVEKKFFHLFGFCGELINQISYLSALFRCQLPVDWYAHMTFRESFDSGKITSELGKGGVEIVSCMNLGGHNTILRHKTHEI